MLIPLVGSIGTPELLLIAGIIILLFGAAKLPELARGSGRALRIFKAETKGLHDDDGETADRQPGASGELGARTEGRVHGESEQRERRSTES